MYAAPWPRACRATPPRSSVRGISYKAGDPSNVHRVRTRKGKYGVPPPVPERDLARVELGRGAEEALGPERHRLAVRRGVVQQFPGGWSAVPAAVARGAAHQLFTKKIVPFGRKKPSYVSSSVSRCGRPALWSDTAGRWESRDVPSGPTGIHRRTSAQSARTYGRRSRSANVGSRSGPTTASSSACARRWASGKSVIARKNDVRAEAVWSGVSTRASLTPGERNARYPSQLPGPSPSARPADTRPAARPAT